MSKGRAPGQRPPTVEERAAAYIQRYPGLYMLNYAHDEPCPVGISTQDIELCICDPDVSLVRVADGSTVVRWLPDRKAGLN